LSGGRAGAAAPTFGRLGDDAAATLRTRLSVAGGWQLCTGAPCGTSDQDWGADGLTAAVVLRWRTSEDRAMLPLARALVRKLHVYTTCRGVWAWCTDWSDIPVWDAVAGVRLFAMTGDATALARARAAYASVADSDVYARGACPALDYQRPFGRGGGLKTLETNANRVLAAVLLAQQTNDPAYLADARARYAAIRRWYYDRSVGLYTVYLFDDGVTCRALPHRFFASVNGVMIDAARMLAQSTHDTGYTRDAQAAMRALGHLDDARGIFTDLQAENDDAAPLVVAVDGLARGGDPVARAWLLRNAAAAAHARTPDGLYGRFFDGPPPRAVVTAWQTAGGLALAIAAGALAPHARVERDDPWPHAHAKPLRNVGVPATLRFTGSGVALLGTIGALCCEPGHARVFIDGRETTDGTGIWQNKSSSGRPLPNSVLFAWRWPRRGRHVLRFAGGVPNAKEGGPFLRLTEALIAP
jgi:hypothetical protein